MSMNQCYKLGIVFLQSVDFLYHNERNTARSPSFKNRRDYCTDMRMSSLTRDLICSVRVGHGF